MKMVIKYQYLLMMCLIIFCKSKDKPNETPMKLLKKI